MSHFAFFPSDVRSHPFPTNTQTYMANQLLLKVLLKFLFISWQVQIRFFYLNSLNKCLLHLIQELCLIIRFKFEPSDLVFGLLIIFIFKLLCLGFEKFFVFIKYIEEYQHILLIFIDKYFIDIEHG